MDSRKVLFAVPLGGAALITVMGILLTPYKDSSKRKKITDKIKGNVDEVGETLNKTVSNVKNQIKTMDEEIDRMVNEGGL